MPQIKIDPRYWDTVKNDYSDWRFAWPREAGQNSLDAGATEIRALVTQEDDIVTVSWTDDGKGMTEDILVNKFLALGGSFKTSGNTGGFGVAKSVLAFAQVSYEIRTGTIRLHGSGCEYDIERDLPHVNGVTLTVRMTATQSDKDRFREVTADGIRANIRCWAAWSSTSCRIYLDGERLDTLWTPRKAKLELPWAKVYVHRKGDDLYPYKLRVRINGQYMFSVWSDVKRHVTVDIVGTNSQQYLTANRDGLNWQYRDRLTKVVAQIFQDPSKITENEIPVINIYRGTGGKIPLAKPRKVKAAAFSPPFATPKVPSTPIKPSVTSPLTADDILMLTEDCPTYDDDLTYETLRDGHDFVVMNSLNRDIPEKWLPGSLSKHAAKLMTRWVEVLKFCAPFCGVTNSISVGWVFSMTAEAVYKYDSDHGYMVLLNPVKVENNRLKQRWDGTSKSFYALVADAIHELTHFAWQSHGEGFANAITDNMAKVLAHYPSLELIRKRTR